AGKRAALLVLAAARSPNWRIRPIPHRSRAVTAWRSSAACIGAGEDAWRGGASSVRSTRAARIIQAAPDAEWSLHRAIGPLSDESAHEVAETVAALLEVAELVVARAGR